MRAADHHPPKAHLPHDFIQRTLADQKFLGHVAHAVERGPEQSKQIAFELVSPRHGAIVGGAGDVVAAEQDAHAANADQDADDLGRVVANVQEEERNQNDEDNGPEVDQLRGEDGGVAVREDGEVISFHIKEGEDDIC